MKRFGRMALVLSIAMIMTSAAGCSGGSSGSSTQPEGGSQAPAGEAGTQEDGGTVGDAEKKLVIYSPSTEAQINAVVPLFSEKYGIECEVITGNTGEVVARADAEKESPYADVIFGGGASTYSQYRDVFEDYVTTNDDELIDTCKNTTGYITNHNVDATIIVVNTDLIGDIEINGYEDLLNPALKGKIAFADPTVSSNAYAHIVAMLEGVGGGDETAGWDFIAKFIENLDGKLQSGSGAVWKAVADGEMVVGTSYEEAGITLVRDGAPIKVVYAKEGVSVDPSTSGLIKNCRHPENGKLFLDFIMTKEVQNIFCSELGIRPARDDVDYPDYFVPASEINVLHEDKDFYDGNSQTIVNRYMDVFQDVYPG